jgi:hypothetical protein
VTPPLNNSALLCDQSSSEPCCYSGQGGFRAGRAGFRHLTAWPRAMVPELRDSRTGCKGSTPKNDDHRRAGGERTRWQIYLRRPARLPCWRDFTNRAKCRGPDCRSVNCGEKLTTVSYTGTTRAFLREAYFIETAPAQVSSNAKNGVQLFSPRSHAGPLLLLCKHGCRGGNPMKLNGQSQSFVKQVQVDLGVVKK